MLGASESDEETALQDLAPTTRRSTGVAGSLTLRRALSAVAVLGAAACAIGLLTDRERPLPGAGAGAGVGTPPAPLLRIEPSAVVSEFDPLASLAAEHGVPGMPSGKDEDSSYLAFATGGKESYWNGPYTQETTTAPPELLPHEVMGASTCGSNEELFTGLCYKKCSLMTNGSYPHRTSAWNCCKETNIFTCMLPSETKFKATLLGTGYDIGGGGGIPHPPGACLENEENYLNMCYKTCSLLTFGEYPVRSGPNTCCKSMPCLNIFNVKSLGASCSGYNIGGGTDAKYKCAHNPQLQSVADAASTS